MIHVLSISGGKDSTALWLWALETGLSPILPLFCDTKWEKDETYAYLDFLEARLGSLVRLTSEGFEERTRRLGTFPSRIRKWCTAELKVAICAEELNRLRDRTGDDVEVLVGVRREESEKRKDLTEREWHEDYDCEVWRPLIDWTLADVIAAHNRARIPLNPLYKARRRTRRLLALHSCAEVRTAVDRRNRSRACRTRRGHRARHRPDDVHD